ncbi:hypothetical protein VTN02DRAFT_2303 [Thermoascus thermophilus]
MRLLIQPPLCTLSSVRLRAPLPSSRFRFAWRSSTRRLLSSSASSSTTACAEESVEVPVGGNGYVSLSVLRPAVSLPSDPARPNVILYLPPGPLFQTRPAEEGGHGSTRSHAQQVLASTTLCTVVTVNYRLGQVGTASEPPNSTTTTTEEKENDPAATKAEAKAEVKAPPFFKYPTPIHDTLAGFDWIRETLDPARLCVFGTHIGGSLALMLALTEPKTVHAVAAREPVCDWVELDEYCTIPQAAEVGDDTEPQQARRPPPSRRNAQRRAAAPPEDLVPLLEARERFFLSAERYFDAFASPILFLRSAGADVPRAFPTYHTGPEYPVPVLKTPELLLEEEEQPLGLQRAHRGWESDDGEEKPVRRVKALSRWPPFGLDYDVGPATRSALGPRRLAVTLPWVRVLVPGRKGRRRTVLARQAEEMVSAMQRACFFGLEKGFGEHRVQLIVVPEAARPAGDSDSDTAVEEAGKWFREVLEEEQEQEQDEEEVQE